MPRGVYPRKKKEKKAKTPDFTKALMSVEEESKEKTIACPAIGCDRKLNLVVEDGKLMGYCVCGKYDGPVFQKSLRSEK